ncbi:hypothetical protein LNQ49_06620 [Flavobacterium sp. F-65]|uniref:Uncharacterized protein n=1 Tax=Flavobacterium pisciphilum TaxID=2893755 RepID=A0ABS8MT31_9FLAO|nr:hypothetical protein [Flavobacterium sp. F-65]MCC9071267.1 hypothetical protein [Flavobacterium sp. F-65]
MRNYLENTGVFYHISPVKNRASIETHGIKRSQKGICVLRTNDQGIINVVINSQLHEIKDGDIFILVTIKIPVNALPIYTYEPDILTDTDWTWPLHNNIIVDNISTNYITEIAEYTYNLQQAEQDVSSRHLYENQPFFNQSFNLIYENHYKINTNGSLDNLEKRKLVKSIESQYIIEF